MINNDLNILFLGGAKRVSIAHHFIQAGKQLGLTVHIFSYELDLQVPIACTATVLIGKKWRDPEIIQDLQSVCSQHKIGIVLPFVDPAIEIAARLKSCTPNVFIPVSNLNLCRTMFDKRKAQQWFENLSIKTPTVYHYRKEVVFPAILKPATGSASKGIVIAYNQNDLDKIQDFENYLAQEYIDPHREYTVDCYVSQTGETVCCIPRIRIETAGGEAIRTKTIKNPTLIETSKKILSSPGYEGPITIQFIENIDNGNIYIMEINPRIGGGAVACIAAGCNIPLYIILEWMGEKISPCNEWTENILVTRYLQEVIFYANNH